MTPPARWPGTPPELAEDHEPAPGPRSRPARGTPYIESLSSSSSARRAPAQRLDALLREWRVNKQQSGDLWRRRCQILLEIRADELWRGAGDADFDAWAQRVLHLKPDVVTRMLGIARGPIGGEGQPHPGWSAAARERSRQAQAGEVEVTASSLNLQTDQAAADDPAGDFPGWFQRTVDRLVSATAGRFGQQPLTASEAAALEHDLDRLSAFLADCRARLAGAGLEPDFDLDFDLEDSPF